MALTYRIPPEIGRQLESFLYNHYPRRKWSIERRPDLTGGGDSHWHFVAVSQATIDLAHAFVRGFSAGVAFNDPFQES